MENKLTEQQKQIITTLRRNTGSYLVKTKNFKGTDKYKLHDKNVNPLMWCSVKDVLHLIGLNWIVRKESNVLIFNSKKTKTIL